MMMMMMMMTVMMFVGAVRHHISSFSVVDGNEHPHHLRAPSSLTIQSVTGGFRNPPVTNVSLLDSVATCAPLQSVTGGFRNPPVTMRLPPRDRSPPNGVGGTVPWGGLYQ